MERKQIFFALIVLCAGILSCSKDNSTAPVVTDQEAVTQIVTSADSVAQYLSSQEASINDGGLQFTDAGGIALHAKVGSELGEMSTTGTDSVVKWGRNVFTNQIVRNYSVTITGDSIAIVTIITQVPGEFLIAWGTRPLPSPSDSVVIDTVVHKPFTEVMKRKVELKRIARNADPLRNWFLTRITIVAAKTEGSVSFGIDSLEIKDSSIGFDSTYVAPPLQNWFRFGRYRESVPIFHVGDTVTVRLSVSGSDSLPEVVTLHHGVAGSGSLPFRERMFMVTQTGGPGHYTRIFQRKITPTLPSGVLIGRFNVLADVFPRRCIYSKTAIFENEFWGLPYIMIR